MLRQQVLQADARQIMGRQSAEESADDEPGVRGGDRGTAAPAAAGDAF